MNNFTSVVVLGVFSYICFIFPADVLYSHQVSYPRDSGLPHRVKLALKDFTAERGVSAVDSNSPSRPLPEVRPALCTRSEDKEFKLKIGRPFSRQKHDDWINFQRTVPTTS